MELREEVRILRGHVDQSQLSSEAELQKRLGEYLGPVKKLIDNAMGNMVSLSDNLTQSMQLVSQVLQKPRIYSVMLTRVIIRLGYRLRAGTSES